MYSHITHNIRINQAALIVTLELLAANTFTANVVTIAFDREWRFHRRVGRLHGPYWRTIVVLGVRRGVVLAAG